MANISGGLRQRSDRKTRRSTSGKAELRISGAVANVLRDADGEIGMLLRTGVDQALKELEIQVDPTESPEEALYKILADKHSPEYQPNIGTAKVDLELINLILPACFRIEGRDIVIDGDILAGLFGPSVLLQFRLGGTLEFLSLPIIAATIIILFVHPNEQCVITPANASSGDTYNLRAFFVMKAVTAFTVWAANALLQAWAYRLYEKAFAGNKMVSEEVKAEVQRVIDSGKEPSQVLQLWRKRKMTDASLKSGLEMIMAYDIIITSKAYRLYQILYIPDVMTDILGLIVLADFVRGDQADTCPYKSNRDAVNFLMFLGLWASITLVFRFAMLCTWLSRALFFTRAGLYSWGKGYAKSRDERLFFGLPLAKTFFKAMYSKHRKQRMRHAYEPLQRRTHKDLLAMRISRLQNKKLETKLQLRAVCEELDKAQTDQRIMYCDKRGDEESSDDFCSETNYYNDGPDEDGHDSDNDGAVHHADSRGQRRADEIPDRDDSSSDDPYDPYDQAVFESVDLNRQQAPQHSGSACDSPTSATFETWKRLSAKSSRHKRSLASARSPRPSGLRQTKRSHTSYHSCDVEETQGDDAGGHARATAATLLVSDTVDRDPSGAAYFDARDDPCNADAKVPANDGVFSIV
eukprot:m.769878 g.769878  ORF g.769878 m.769878 type:complete len:636 (-) comp23237_c0_seq6:357-2264(-)